MASFEQTSVNTVHRKAQRGEQTIRSLEHFLWFRIGSANDIEC